MPTHHIPLRQFSPNALVLIGASTGGIDALIRILRHWTTEAPPCLIVQHTGSNHMESLKRLLDGVTQATVTIAKDAERLSSGTIYLAPGRGTHLCIDSRKPMRTRLVAAPPVSGHCPSIDMLFHSAIGHGPNVIAALLTGMGRDGAQGLSALRNAGAMTFGQDQETCIVYGMPRIAKELGGVVRELPIDRIGPALLESARKSSSAA